MAAPVDAGSIYSDVRIRLDRLSGDIKSVQTSLDKITKASKKTTKESKTAFGKFFSFLKKTGVGSILTFAGAFLVVKKAITTTIRFLKDSEVAAQNAQEVYSKFDTVFESIAESANAAADDFAKSFGVAGSTARELIGATGDLLVGMGATEEVALDLSTQVNILAADLASFSNIQGGTKRASEALTAALLGETERMKLLGVVIRQTDVQQELLERGQEKLTGQALLLAKAQITLAMATEQSGKAIGDAGKTFFSAANVSKRLEETQKALREEIGIGISEAMTPLRIATDKLITKFTEWLKKGREVKDVMAEIGKSGKTTSTDVEVLELAIQRLNDQLNQARGQENREGVSESIKGLEAQLIPLQEQLELANQIVSARQRTAAFEKQYANDITATNARLLIAAQAEEERLMFTEERIRQQEELAKAFASIEEQEKLFGKAFDGRAAKEEAVRKVLLEMIKFGFTAEGAGIQKITDQYGAYFETVKKGRTEIVAAGDDYLSQILEERDHLIWIDELETEIHDRRLEESEERTRKDQEEIQKRIASITTYAGLVISILTSLRDFESAANDAELLELEESLAKKLSNAEAEGASDEELAALKTSNEEELAAKKRELAVEEAKRGKALSLINIAINTASAVVAALVSIPPNVPLSIAVGATGAIQAALVAATPIPSFQTGGIVLPSRGGSLINVAENNSPELMLNSGASGQALLADFAKQIVDKMGGGVIQLMLPNGKIIAETAAAYYNNGIVPLRLN